MSRGRVVWGVFVIVLVGVLVSTIPSNDAAQVTIDAYNRSGGNAAFYPESSYLYYEGEHMEQRFRLYGVSNGTIFAGEYSDAERGRFQIDGSLTPGDGVSEGFAVPRPDNGTLTISFYVDAKFKEAMTPSTLTYGRQAEHRVNPAWTAVSAGVFKTTIRYGPIESVDDADRIPVFLGNGVPGQASNITGIGIY